MKRSTILSNLTCAILLATIGCAEQTKTAILGESSNQPFLEKGSYAMWQGRWSDAAAEYTEAVALHPGDWMAQYHLGQCYMEMDNPQMASQSLAIAESLRPANTDIADLYAEALLRAGERDHLYTFLQQRAQKLQTARAWMVFAEYTMDLDDPDSAMNAINTAIAIDSGDNARPYIIAATFAERLGDDELAITRWQEAWIIEPTSPQISDALRGHGIVPGPTMTGVDDSQ